jgi:hypothetical protein
MIIFFYISLSIFLLLVPVTTEGECNNVVILSLIIFYFNLNQHVNLYKYKVFWNSVASRGVIN